MPDICCSLFASHSGRLPRDVCIAMAANTSSSDSLDYGTSPEEVLEAAAARSPAGDPPLEANTSQQREEFSGAAVARSETGGPPVEMSSTPQGATPGDLCAADAQATIRREREVSASPTPERPQRAARAAVTRSESRPRDVGLCDRASCGCALEESSTGRRDAASRFASWKRGRRDTVRSRLRPSAFPYRDTGRPSTA